MFKLISIKLFTSQLSSRPAVVAVVLALCAASNVSLAQPGPGFGRGFRGGQGQNQPGHARQDDRHEDDRQVFQFLLANHNKITRTVTEIANGVETLTESDDPAIAAKIQEHVHWMTERIEKQQPIRMRDPLFAEIFRNSDKIVMKSEKTPKGIRVTETSDDPKVVKLIQAHAKVVSAFVEKGHVEAMKNHPVPTAEPADKNDLTWSFPLIEKHGPVVRLDKAAHQPRQGTKILVDVTRASEPNELNPAIEKIAKYLNIYAGGGAEPASAQFAVVFHGDATLAVLNDEAYAAKFQVDRNPNLELLHSLHERGVELFVCGQTLISKEAKPEEVAVFVDTAVSALTVVVNLQSDGYTHITLAK